MNEQIREITGQVLDELVPETWVALGYDKIKEIQYRTAELIVRECMQIIDDSTPVYSTRDMNEDYCRGTLNGYQSALLEIKEHFGVEE